MFFHGDVSMNGHIKNLCPAGLTRRGVLAGIFHHPYIQSGVLSVQQFCKCEFHRKGIRVLGTQFFFAFRSLEEPFGLDKEIRFA
jgi:hypothetical protein